MTWYTIRTGATQHPESSVLQLITDLIVRSGVIGLGAGDLLVTQQTSPDMSVKIAIGRAWVKGTGNGYPIRSDAATTVTIGANASGNPRKDAIVIYVNLSASVNTDGSGVITAVAVQGTPAGSPTSPNDATIQAAIGASNPFIRVADVTVASGASSIVNANILDTRAPVALLGSVAMFPELAATPATPATGFAGFFTDANGNPAYIGDDGQARPMGEDQIKTLTDGATVTIDCSDKYKMYMVVLGGNRAFALTNAYNGRKFVFHIGQDPTGSRIPTWFNKASTFATTDVNTSTEVITVNRNIPTGTPIKFSSTTTVPAGLVAGTKYYAINNSSTTIKVASSLANAQAGTAIDLTSQGTGTHTITTEIAWANDTEPTLQTGKYQSDTVGIIVRDATNGIYLGYSLGAGFPTT